VGRVSADPTAQDLRAENEALRALLDRLLEVTEAARAELDAAGIEPPEPPTDQPCRVWPPPRRCRTGGRRAW